MLTSYIIATTTDLSQNQSRKDPSAYPFPVGPTLSIPICHTQSNKSPISYLPTSEFKNSKGLFSKYLEYTNISILRVSNSEDFKSWNSKVKVLSQSGEKVLEPCSVFFSFPRIFTTAYGLI